MASEILSHGANNLTSLVASQTTTTTASPAATATVALTDENKDTTGSIASIFFYYSSIDTIPNRQDALLILQCELSESVSSTYIMDDICNTILSYCETVFKMYALNPCGVVEITQHNHQTLVPFAQELNLRSISATRVTIPDHHSPPNTSSSFCSVDSKTSNVHTKDRSSSSSSTASSLLLSLSSPSYIYVSRRRSSGTEILRYNLQNHHWNYPHDCVYPYDNDYNLRHHYTYTEHDPIIPPMPHICTNDDNQTLLSLSNPPRLLIISDCNDSKNGCCQVYDITTRTWSILVMKSYRPTCMIVFNNTIYGFGGRDSHSCTDHCYVLREEKDPHTGTIICMAWHRVCHMFTYQWGVHCVVIDDSIVIMGGHQTPKGDTPVYPYIYEYKPFTRRWSKWSHCTLPNHITSSSSSLYSAGYDMIHKQLMLVCDDGIWIRSKPFDSKLTQWTKSSLTTKSSSFFHHYKFIH